ncbi:MAG: hypothetical protein VX438_18605, partial [Planctomycetota bacterium]|nr:hypothetical protein [Planctomycetota bacterium]
MKLTLRTLIAFLDETIDENDAAELRKKIKESEAIRELIERIRQIISQPQLMALRVAGKGLGADSNYSSEYIDNTLDLEQVAEFEKLAIDSDMLLAEIAESHQILANFNQTDEAVSLRLQSRLHKTVQTIYPVDPEEPEVFPVIEDHSSIHEDYEDVSPPKKKKTRTNLAPPIIETVQDGDPANPVTHSPTVHAPPVIQSIQPPPPTSSIEDSNGPLQPGLTPLSSNTKKSKGSGCSLGEPTDPSDKNQQPRIKILPVVLATACITSLLFLVIASFVNPNVPEIASNDLKNNVKSSTQEQANHKEQTSKPETDGSSTETGGEVTRPILKTKSNKEQQGERPTTIPTRDSKTTAAGNGSNPKERPPQTPETIAERQGQEKEVVNLFKDKDYENKKTPLPESRELAANTNTNQSTVPKIDPSKKLTDTKVLMSKTASLVNGPSIGIIKSDQEPAVRRTNLNEAKWVSLGQEQTIHLNDRVAALPGCRPTIEIMGSVRLHLFGFCEIEFKENPGKVIPQLLVRNGIVTLENMKDPNNTIDVSIQGTNY